MGFLGHRDTLYVDSVAPLVVELLSWRKGFLAHVLSITT
jgi:hypothetical protein